MSLKTRKYLFIIMVIALASCNKNNDDAPAVAMQPAGVAFLNLVPDASSLNFYINGTRQNTNKVSYQETSGYLSISPGTQNASFKDTTFNLISQAPVPVTLKPDSSYTLFLTGQAAANTVTAILASDYEKVDPVIYKPKVRFVNAAPGSPALDVYFNKVLLLSGKTYKSVSGYARPDTGAVAFKLNIAGTATTIFSVNIKLAQSSVYTVYAYGLFGTTGSKAFSVAAITNH